jgi:hypothetical protein
VFDWWIVWCAQLHDLFDAVGDETPPPAGQDVSAEQWLRNKGATPLQLEVADVCYANDFGCSLQQLGLREMITENQRLVVNVAQHMLQVTTSAL